jgi:hypothetical protein
MFQVGARVARRLLLFTIPPPKRNIPHMRTGVLVIALLFMLYDWGGQRHSARSATPWTTKEDPATELQLKAHAAAMSTSSNSTSESRDAKSRVDFNSQIKPIFQSRCMPCHFSGGTMYERLPFDRPETIKKLGPKLFTRIQDENHRRLIREFLAQ